MAGITYHGSKLLGRGKPIPLFHPSAAELCPFWPSCSLPLRPPCPVCRTVKYNATIGRELPTVVNSRRFEPDNRSNPGISSRTRRDGVEVQDTLADCSLRSRRESRSKSGCVLCI